MLARALATTPWGIDARPIQIEIDVRQGLPQVQIVGLPDAAVRESRERVRAAIKNCGFDLPPRAVIINLAPADLKKEGNHLDLPIALALLAAHGHLPVECLDGRLINGELGLDGTVRPIRGGLAMADLAGKLGVAEILLPASNSGEAAAMGGAVPIIPVQGLAEAIEHLVGVRAILKADQEREETRDPDDLPDLSEVRGQETAKRALEIAAAGGHNLIFIGPPGSGKTMMARRLPRLLPSLTRDEALAVTKVHSLSSPEPPTGLIWTRPFRSPHHGTSNAGMIGGGSHPRPGEVSLAHGGVLFLDELPEFRRETLEALRQPLEEGYVTVVRVRARLRFPARFTLLAAMNPCRCGHLGDARHECRCTPFEVDRYRRRISGPLLDRIDLHVEVPAVALKELKSPSGESSQAVAERVLAARKHQEARFSRPRGPRVNAYMGPLELRDHCRLDDAAQRLLDKAFERLGLSARALHRLLKVGRTIADLESADTIQASHIAEAIQYRSLDRRMQG